MFLQNVGNRRCADKHIQYGCEKQAKVKAKMSPLRFIFSQAKDRVLLEAVEYCD